MYHGEWFNSISHLCGAVLALIGTSVLVGIAIHQDDSTKIVSFAVYGTALVLLYLMSTLYHSFRGRAKEVFHKLDHIGVYLLIAGTYTPLTLVTLRGSWGWTLFAIVWTLAVIGIAQDLVFNVRRRVLSVVLCLLMGWLVVVAVGPLVRSIPPAGVAWLFAGGIFYSIGVVFFALSKRLRFGHAVWHVFVLLGSVSHYISLLGWVALKPA
jgi:hemolysin III